MTELAALGGDLGRALTDIGVPSYAINPHGIIRWINPAGRKIVGDVRGRQYTSVCAPEETRHAREVFAQKVVGGAKVTDVEGVLIDANGDRIKVEISSVPLYSGGHIVGVFGEVINVEEDEERPPHPRLTPRQAEVLRLLERGHSTAKIAEELHLSLETVRNHIRHLMRALGVHTRLEAVAVARHGELVAS